MAARIPDSLIDEILASAKSYMGEDSDVKYSADEIDSIIAEISDGEKTEPEVTEKTGDPVVGR